MFGRLFAIVALAVTGALASSPTWAQPQSAGSSTTKAATNTAKASTGTPGRDYGNGMQSVKPTAAQQLKAPDTAAKSEDSGNSMNGFSLHAARALRGR